MNNSSKREKPVNSTKSITIDEESYLKNKSINQESIGFINDNKHNFSDQMIKSNIEDSSNVYNDFNYQSGGLSGSNTFKNLIGSKEISNRDGNFFNKNYESKNSEIKEEIFHDDNNDNDDDGFEPINYD
jgi:hypothetical protein